MVQQESSTYKVKARTKKETACCVHATLARARKKAEKKVFALLTGGREQHECGKIELH